MSNHGRGGWLTVTIAVALLSVSLPASLARGSPRHGVHKLWVQRYDGPVDQIDGATAVATSPAGSRSSSATGGSVVWGQRFDGRGGDDWARAVLPSADGATLFVTGRSYSPGRGYD